VKPWSTSIPADSTHRHDSTKAGLTHSSKANQKVYKPPTL
jgi:hypothetical protein